MRESVAAFACENQDAVVFGAPNVLRGGSHMGSPGAAEMVAAERCHILASDYYYPSMLGAVAKLAQDEVQPLHELWRLVSTNPAKAMKLDDRGEIRTGMRADLVLLDWPENICSPATQTTFSNGRIAYSCRKQ